MHCYIVGFAEHYLYVCGFIDLKLLFISTVYL